MLERNVLDFINQEFENATCSTTSLGKNLRFFSKKIYLTPHVLLLPTNSVFDLPVKTVPIAFVNLFFQRQNNSQNFVHQSKNGLSIICTSAFLKIGTCGAKIISAITHNF